MTDLALTASCQSEVGPVSRLAVKHASNAFVNQQAINEQWQDLNYQARPVFERAIEEYDGFVALLEGLGVELEFLPANNRVGLDSIYVRDASVVCGDGLILCNMGKTARRGEPAAQERALRDIGVPIRGAIQQDGRLEGGDVTWIDEGTVAVGRGYRTNDEGIRQLRELLADCVDELIVVPLPHWRGPSDVFHLMSIISPLDRDLMLVYSPLLPVPFREALLARDITLIDVPESEFETMACNVLAVAPRQCVMLAGNPQTRARLAEAGVDVHEYEGREISAKGAGGPTCLTRPIVRR